MASDMEIIRQIEEQIGKELKRASLDSIMIPGINGFALDKARNVVGLNLDGERITDISMLKGLGGLTQLSLMLNEITDLAPLASLTNLTSLDLSENQITELTPLSLLPKLTSLDLSENQITDLTPLSLLPKLTSLDISYNQITDFTLLAPLVNLTYLNLGGSQLKNLTLLSPLKKLKWLNLYGNQITDIAPLARFTKFQGLNLEKNQITDLTPLALLVKLKKLYIDHNQITSLTPLAPLTKLTSLGLNNNQITGLTPLASLTELLELRLNKNQITDLTPLRELKNLEHLDLKNNFISQLPPDITSWWPHLEIKWEVKPFLLEGVNFYGNPLTDPPVEIVKQGNAAIANYFAEIREASVLFLESKLLLVGSGDVGKTTLMKKLKDNSFNVVPGKEDTTRGIDIQPWTLSCPFPDVQNRDVNIHFWDFAGQDILHATHQFFLTKRSLYLFVWDPRKEEDTRGFDYWLHAVELFGTGSPLVMVMNKADMRIKHIDEASIKGQYPNIQQFHQVSCLTGQDIKELTETIRSSLGSMPHLLDKLPKRWLDIRDELKARKENYISLDDYVAVCAGHGMDKEKALFLSDYLHDLGIILHFRHDPVLADTVILKPEWATGAVYNLIDSLEIQQKKGRFSRADLSRYWPAKTYPASKHNQLLRLMEKFELCFNILETDDYIIPELLASQRPAGVEPGTYSSAESLQLHYAYPFMPAGILTRLICRLHYLVRDEHYWNSGVELEFSGSRALVVSDTQQKRIRVSVSGGDKNQLMGVIRGHFDHIHHTMNMNKDEHVFEEVPCICNLCKSLEKPHIYTYNLLQKLRQKNRDAFCEKSGDDVPVHQLLMGLLPPVQPGNLFDNLVTIASQVQGIRKTLQKDENSRNAVVALLLQTRGFLVKDQSLYGSSETGNRIGVPDILVLDETGRTSSIIEALILDSLDTATIDRHILKVFHNYDCSGLQENYILVYASAKNFEALCNKYRDHLPKIDYSPYPLEGNIETPRIKFNKIAAFRVRHRCNKGETVLTHLLVEM